MHLLAWFDELPKDKLSFSAGGKGASLCLICRNKLPIPGGFIVCAEALTVYEGKWFTRTGLKTNKSMIGIIIQT